jgi:hypothetical protein
MYRRPRDRELRQKILWRRRQIIGAELRNYLQSLTREIPSRFQPLIYGAAEGADTPERGENAAANAESDGGILSDPQVAIGGAYRGAVPDPLWVGKDFVAIALRS